VVDFGCGPGEITCELAARRVDLQFVGVDHSAAAIHKANANIARRGLSNINFECADVERFTRSVEIGLATLFDAFHHLTNPAAFVQRLSPHVERWALIEPRGSWAGTWQKDLDFDWVAQDLDKIRAHVAYLCGEEAGPAKAGHHRDQTDPAQARFAVGPRFGPADSGEAVERRYTLDDFERFFDKRDGWTMDLRGTVAGLESYPPGADRDDELRDRFGELRYQIYRDIDEWLFARNLDLHAKHWLIVAARGGRTRRVNLRRQVPPATSRFDVAGPYDVRYGEYRGPRDARPGERLMASVELTNEGRRAWSSDPQMGIFTSYHWLDDNGHVVEFDGERTPLPGSIDAGETTTVALVVRAPSSPGPYRLAIDLVCEGVTWFSQTGRPCLEVPFQIR